MATRRVRNPSRRRRARRVNPVRYHRRKVNPAPVHHRRRRRNPAWRRAAAPALRRRRNGSHRRRRNPDFNNIMEHAVPFAEVGIGMIAGIAANRILPIKSRKGLKLRGLLHVFAGVGLAMLARNRHATNLGAGVAGAGVLDLFRQNVPSVARYLQADAVETVLGIEEGPMQADSLGIDSLGAEALGYDELQADALGADSLGYEGMSGENDLD